MDSYENGWLDGYRSRDCASDHPDYARGWYAGRDARSEYPTVAWFEDDDEPRGGD